MPEPVSESGSELAEQTLGTPENTAEGSGFYAYLLECADGTLYAGWTTNPQRRLEQHNLGKGAKYTRARLPVALQAVWQFDTRNEAMRFEWELKRMPRSRKLKLMAQAPFRQASAENNG